MDDTSAWNRAQARVERLSVRYSGSPGETNAIALRQRVERLLDGVDLHPAGLHSGAVLIVRKLHNLAPVSLSTLSRTGQAVWKENVRDQVATLYYAAARPAHGLISSHALSVLFADSSEMLTCLTRDLLSGQAWQHWYWQQLLHRIPRTTSSALVTIWGQQAMYVPAVLGSLPTPEACEAISLLSPQEVMQVIYALHSSFDVPSTVLTKLLQEVRFQALYTGASPGTPARETTSNQLPEILPGGQVTRAASRIRSETSHDSEHTGESLVLPPWQRWLSRETHLPQWSLPASYLFGLALALYRAPAFARSAGFAVQAAAWLRTELRLATRANSVQLEQKTVQAFPAKDTVASSEDAPGQPNASSSLEAPESTKPESPTEFQSMPASDSSPVIEPSAEPQAMAKPLQPRSLDETGSPSVSVSINKQVVPPAKEFIFAGGQSLPVDGVTTELGGVLYLINLLTWLNLPSEWDDGGTFSEHLSGWAILEILARGLFVAMPASLLEDPMWKALATLDGRELGAHIGARLPMQTAFRLPARWLRSYGPAEPFWIATINDARLLLFEEAAGYLVADIPLANLSPDEALAAEMETYRARGVDASIKWLDEIGTITHLGTMTFLGDNSAWWLERVLGFVRYLLVCALGKSDSGESQLAAMLLRKQGRLLVSRTHIDLHMSMEQISLSLRCAGLDRDPGWVPDLGRIILFHFD